MSGRRRERERKGGRKRWNKFWRWEPARRCSIGTRALWYIVEDVDCFQLLAHNPAALHCPSWTMAGAFCYLAALIRLASSFLRVCLFPPALIAVPFFWPWIVLSKSWLEGPPHSCRTIAPIANSQLKVTLCYLNSIFLQESRSIFFGKEILTLVSVKGNSTLSYSMAYFGRRTCFLSKFVILRYSDRI